MLITVTGVPALQAAIQLELSPPIAEWSWSFLFGTYWPTFLTALAAWVGVAAGGTILFVIVTLLLDANRVTVQESGPAHVTQFRTLFDEILQKANTTQVILIDELDRCSPDGVMRRSKVSVASWAMRSACSSSPSTSDRCSAPMRSERCRAIPPSFSSVT